VSSVLRVHQHSWDVSLAWMAYLTDEQVNCIILLPIYSGSH